MYLLAGNNSALEVFNINGVGQLERIQKLDIGTPIRQAGLPLGKLAIQKWKGAVLT
jgi:hypothetical protein